MTTTDSINWNRRVWRLAGPIMLSNITIPLLGIVDTAVVGHLEHAYYCIAPGFLDTSLSHAAGLSDIAVCHA